MVVKEKYTLRSENKTWIEATGSIPLDKKSKISIELVSLFLITKDRRIGEASAMFHIDLSNPTEI